MLCHFRYTKEVKTSLSALYFFAHQTVLMLSLHSRDPINVPLFGFDVNPLNPLISVFLI